MALRDDILARWGQFGEWDAAGVDRADELALLLQANGITDLSVFDNAKLKQTPYTSSGVWGADPETGLGGQQMEFEGWDRSLQLGDNTFGFLGNVGRGGAFEANTAQPFLKGTEDPNSYLLGWSAQGKGNTSYNLVTTPDGKLVVVPTWGSSSDWDSVRTAATVVGGALLAGYGLNGALGAEAAAGAGSTVGMTGAEAAAMAGGEVAAGTAGTQAAGASTGLLSGGTAGSTAAGSGIKFAASSLAPELGASLTAGTTAGVQGGSTLFSLGSWGLTGKDLITLGIAGMQGVAQSRQNEKNQEATDRRRAEDRENYLTDRQAVWNREDQKTAERDAKTEREKQEAFARRMPVTGLLAPVLRRRGG